MIISVASGKGGTGKTTVAVNLALSLDNVELIDCDVEEPNAHFFLDPDIEESFSCGIPIPKVDETQCNFCGMCREVCAYNAIAVIKPNGGKKGSVLVFNNLCHGCGACSELCPENAISEELRETGKVDVGKAQQVSFVRGMLNIGETMAPPVIREAKLRRNPEKITVIDSPPGTACPFIAAVHGSDYCILVTEPTPFGLHDLKLALEVVKKLNIPFGVVINKSNLGDDKTLKLCEENNIEILMQIPFDREIAELYSSGIPLVGKKKEYVEKFKMMFENIEKKAGGK